MGEVSGFAFIFLLFFDLFFWSIWYVGISSFSCILLEKYQFFYVVFCVWY